MSPRDRILSAVRSGLGEPRKNPDSIAAEADALLAAPDEIRPRLVASTLVEAFAIRASALGTTLDRIADFADLPAAVGRYLAAHGLAADVALQPASVLAGLDWQDVRPHASLAADEAVAVGLARWGIAEGGSLVIHSAPDTPILLAFLPLHHILVLSTRNLLAHLEDYAAVAAETDAPRNAVLITGPSGTTDIEGSYVRGAHGPGFLHVILVEDDF
jgi:L-lactate dehydrogenase complex protein LldG